MKPVAFLGSADGWENAPLGDKQWKVWTCNWNSTRIPDSEIDVCFDMHDWRTADYYPTYANHLKKKHSYKVIKPRADAEIPNCEVFPLKDAMIFFPNHAFASTLSYVVAYAVVKNIPDLYMWGINTTEFIQYPEMGYSFWYCVGVARTLGTKVHMVSYDVQKAPEFYGYVNYSWKDSYRDMTTIHGSDNYVIKDGAE